VLLYATSEASARHPLMCAGLLSALATATPMTPPGLDGVRNMGSVVRDGLGLNARESGDGSLSSSSSLADSGAATGCLMVWASGPPAPRSMALHNLLEGTWEWLPASGLFHDAGASGAGSTLSSSNFGSTSLSNTSVMSLHAGKSSGLEVKLRLLLC